MVTSESPFFRLPPELRNEIYKYVFTPESTPTTTLIPSPNTLSTIPFLLTCRQIHAEAHLLAHHLAFSVTNRWSRADLESMHTQLSHLLLPSPPTSRSFSSPSNSSAGSDSEIPSPFPSPFPTLEFAAHLTRPSRRPRSAGGGMDFLDAAIDYATFLWNVLEIFGEVNRLVIVLSRDREPERLLQTVMTTIGLDVAWCQARFRKGKMGVKSGGEGKRVPPTEALFWDVRAWRDEMVFEGIGRRAGRRVVVDWKRAD